MYIATRYSISARLHPILATIRRSDSGGESSSRPSRKVRGEGWKECETALRQGFIFWCRSRCCYAPAMSSSIGISVIIICHHAELVVVALVLVVSNQWWFAVDVTPSWDSSYRCIIIINSIFIRRTCSIGTKDDNTTNTWNFIRDNCYSFWRDWWWIIDLPLLSPPTVSYSDVFYPSSKRW
jgi:hypothetical protein